LTVDAGETANVVDRVVANLMNEIIGRHAVSAAVAPYAVVSVLVSRRQA